jgi:leucyl aminopeptidase (aminopeptidase T)
MSSLSLDLLYRRVARKVLTETLGMKKGEALTVETWNNGLDFARFVVAEARAMGCTALTVFEDEGAYVEGVRRAPKDSLGLMGKNEYTLLAGTDAYVFVPGQALSSYSRTLTPAELEDSTRYNSSWYDAAAKAKLRGARFAFGYVGKDLARMLGKSVEKIVKEQLEAALTDYGEVSRRGANLASKLSDGSETTIESGGSSLRFSLRGYLEIEDGLVDEKDLADGNNMTYVPPGYVTKELEPESVEGKLKLSATLTRYGVLAGAELEFKNGVLIGWKGEDRGILKKLLNPIPEGKRKLTVLGIGTNPAMRYGLGQDRFVSGAVFLGGLGLNVFARKATVSAAGNLLVSKGVLRS